MTRTRKSLNNPSNAEKITRREIALERIAELLAEKRRTVIELAAELSIPWNTVYGYMRFMQEMGDAHQTGDFAADRREYWAAGRATGQVPQSIDDNPRRAWVSPARQMGMHHDALVAALFGPAPLGAAA